MNCAEFESYLPEAIDGAYPPQAEQHLHGCRTCSQLAADLTAIARTARELREVDVPGPRVWNSINAALRQEGIVRESAPRPFLVATGVRRWQPAWLLPVAAAFLMAFGIMVYQRGLVHTPAQIAESNSEMRGTEGITDPDDQNLLQAVAMNTPEMRNTYEAGLTSAEGYIRDAKMAADRDPNDEQAQIALAAAYEQRSMIYQMALERSLP